MDVIVIGAGTGGMCLAHALRRAGITVTVFERDRTRSDGLHGYRVGIDPHGSKALKACLPDELYRTFVATCARPPEHFVFFDERLHPTLTLPLRAAADDVNDEKSVSRMTLRQLLFTGMQDVIHFGKTFVRYTHEPDGRVTAHFADGTTATGDLLVAADGVNSPVRRQYLPHARTEDAGIISIAAKVPMTPATTALLPARYFPGIGMILAPGGKTCILHWMEFPWDRQGHLKRDDELLARWPGLLFDNTRDYLNWGFAASADKFPAGVMQYDGEELIRLALRMTPTWSPDLRRLFALGDPSTTFAINIRTSVPIPAWTSTNVTLLGDAIHTMTPGRGVGANTALRDAQRLAEQLTLVRDGRKGLIDGVRDYETRMIEYGFKAVTDSREQMTGDALVHRPVLGRAVLAGMRGYLRVVDRVPALKRHMLNGVYDYRGAEY